MPRAAELRDWIALLGLTMMWGSAFMLNELALESFPPAFIVAGRIVIAASLLFVVMRAYRIQLPRSIRGWRPMIAMAVFGNVLPFNLITWGQQHVTSSLAGVLMAVMPLFVLTLAHFLIPGVRMTPIKTVGFLFGFAGVALIIGPAAPSGAPGGMAMWGAIAILAAALSYAVSTIIARRAGAIEPLKLSAGMMIVGSVLVIPGAALELPIDTAPTIVSTGALLVLGLVATGYASVLYFRIVQGPGPTFVSFVNYLVPAWAVIFGSLFLNEQLTSAVLGGLVLILAGIALSEFGTKLTGLLDGCRGAIDLGRRSAVKLLRRIRLLKEDA